MTLVSDLADKKVVALDPELKPISRIYLILGFRIKYYMKNKICFSEILPSMTSSIFSLFISFMHSLNFVFAESIK
jgi:hypothetical protein